MRLLAKSPRILKSEEQTPKFYENLWKTITKGRIWEGEFVNKHKDGRKYLVEAKYFFRKK